MKNPRDLLFRRHQPAEHDLDRIRQSVVAGLTLPERRSFPSLWDEFWHEFILPCRRIWAGLAAVWIFLLVMDASLADHTQVARRDTPLPSPQMMAAMQEQERWLEEMVGPIESPAADDSRPLTPQPRSERKGLARMG